MASETIYGVHENQSVKRSGQAGGAAHADENCYENPLNFKLKKGRQV